MFAILWFGLILNVFYGYYITPRKSTKFKPPQKRSELTVLNAVLILLHYLCGSLSWFLYKMYIVTIYKYRNDKLLILDIFYFLSISRYYSVNEVQKFMFSRRIDENSGDITVSYVPCPILILLLSILLQLSYSFNILKINNIVNI